MGISRFEVKLEHSYERGVINGYVIDKYIDGLYRLLFPIKTLKYLPIEKADECIFEINEAMNLIIQIMNKVDNNLFNPESGIDKQIADAIMSILIDK